MHFVDGLIRRTLFYMRRSTLFLYGLCFAAIILMRSNASADTGIRISVEEKYVLTENLLEVNLIIDGFDEILTAQGSIRWDVQFLRYYSSTNFALPFFGAASLGTTDVDKGILRFLWTPDDVQARTLPPKSVFFTLVFEAIAPGSSMISLSDEPLILEFSDKNLEKVSVETFAADIHIAHDYIDFFETSPQDDFSCKNDVALGSLFVALRQGNGSFEYIWFDSENQEVGKGEALHQLKSGKYSLKVFDADGLFAGPVPVSIAHKPAILKPETRSVQPNTHCSLANGSIEVEVTAEPASELYQLKGEWFVRKAMEITGRGQGFSLSGLNSDNYHFVARDAVSGCQSDTLLIHINDELMMPELNPDKVRLSHDITCNPGKVHTGSIDVSEAVVIRERSVSPRFAWFDADNNIFAGTARVEGLASGTFTLKLTDPLSDCQSDDIEFVVHAATIQEPVHAIRGTVIDDRLQLIPETQTPSALLEITWFEGKFPSIGNTLSNEFMLEVEKPTTTTAFTARIRHISTACIFWHVYTYEDEVEEAAPTLSIVSYSSVNNTACSPFNGEIMDFEFNEEGIEYVMDAYDTGGFYLFSGKNFSALAGGQYFFVARDLNEQWRASAPIQVHVLDKINLPEIQKAYKTKNTSCIPDERGFTGAAGFSVSGIQEGGVPQIFWYSGDRVRLTAHDNLPEVMNLKDGDYVIEVRDQLSGCTTELAFSIEFEAAELLFDVQTQPNNFCASQYNGSAGLVLTEAPLADYRFFWLYGLNNADTSTAIGRKPEIDQLMPGNYRVILQDIASGCLLEPYSFRIADEPLHPQAEIMQIGDKLEVNIGMAWEWFYEGRSMGELNAHLLPKSSGQYKVLVMNEFNCTAFSPPFDYVITHLKESPSSLKFVKLYPNPVEETIHLHFSDSQSGLAILYDASGSKVWEQYFHKEDRLQISAGRLLPGIYTLMVEGLAGIEMFKLIKK